ncbi:hypothetical protein Acsp03_72250 [Actinomadura sp. NBRC 104412]|nr:hypothetical protein Acsp03_72250 [Actinomadura sp. NBRC 104412]
MLASTVQFSNNNRDHQTPHTQDKRARPAPRQKKPPPPRPTTITATDQECQKGPVPSGPNSVPNPPPARGRPSHSHDQNPLNTREDLDTGGTDRLTRTAS